MVVWFWYKLVIQAFRSRQQGSRGLGRGRKEGRGGGYCCHRPQVKKKKKKVSGGW